ncbi:hypothetical protein MJN54_29915, partial [Salmonella enterica subsp. enterica serovar Kentucky]|nr:hypothetical protein [Salmonella enterica subsp. enterica serovar Kentucky]
MQQLQNVIESAFERRADITPANVDTVTREAVNQVNNVKTCIRGCVLAMLTLFPFAVVIGYLIAPVFTNMILLSMMGN